MIEKIQNKDYLVFVLSKVGKELCQYKEGVNLDEACNLLNKIEESDNPKRDIYLLTRVEGLEPLGRYLLFILKKAETGTIDVENLIQNLQVDKNCIEKEIINSFKVGRLIPEPIKEDQQKDVEETMEESMVSNKSGKTVRQLFVKDNQFKVGKLDNELVTEEFNESDFTELVGSDNMKVKKDYLEDIQIDEGEEEIVFNLPEKMEDVFELLHEEGEKIDQEKKKIIETDFERDGGKLFEHVKKEKETRKEEEKTTVEEVKLEKENEVISKKGEDKEENERYKKEEKKVQEEITREIITEEISKKEKELKEDFKLTEEEKRSTSLRDDEKTTVTEEESKVSIEYMDFEAELFLRNESLKESLKEILTLKKGGEEVDTEFKNKAEEIVGNSTYMEEYSRRMSFDVIAGLYEAIKISFKSAVAKEFEVDKGSGQLFTDALQLMESLVKGYGFKDYEKVIKGLGSMRKLILEKKQERRKIKVLQEKKVEIEKQVSSKYKDETSREQFIKLKNNILEVERTFNSLESIKGEYQVYEALRRLSNIFPHLKDIVNISKQLEQEKAAQLSEASYIFVKFLQNYRLDPFDEDARDILKYVIYNFKLIFLDKPTKDLDLFISYLNNPVKIFEQTKERGKK